MYYLTVPPGKSILPIQQILPFIAEHRAMGKRNMRLAFRNWAREQEG